MALVAPGPPAPSETLLKQDINLGTKAAADGVSILFGNYDLNGEAGTGHSAPALKIVVGNFKLSADGDNAQIPRFDFTALFDITGAFNVSDNANFIALTTNGGSGGAPAFNELARVGGTFTLQNNANLGTAVFPALGRVGGALAISGNSGDLTCPEVTDTACGMVPPPSEILLGGGCSCP